MVMPAQQTQGMSISDILSMAQMMKKPEQQTVPTTGDVPSQTTNTFTRESGSPVQNGVNVPVPPVKPDLSATQGASLSEILGRAFV